MLTSAADQQKDEEKRIKAEAKAAEKARKEQEKAEKTEQKRKAKEEKHRSKEAAKPLAVDLKERVAEEDHHDEAEPSSAAAVVTPVVPVTLTQVEATPIAPAAAEASPAEVEESKAKMDDTEAKPTERRRSKFLKKPLALDLRKRYTKDDDAPATAPLERREPVGSPTTQAAATKERSQSFSGRRESNSPPLEDEPRSGTTKIKNWFSSRFSRPRTKSTASAPGGEDKGSSPDTNAAAGGEGDGGRGFIGGAALRRQTDSSNSSASSLRDVALASVGRDTNRQEEQVLPSTTAPAEQREASPARSVSSVSSSSSEEGVEDETFEEARENVPRTITPPPVPRDPATVARLSVSPGRGSRFSEIID